MLGSALSIFSEPDDFQAALREIGVVDLVVANGEKFWARLARITLGRMRLFACEERQPRAAFMSVPPNMIRITLPIRRGDSLIWDGIVTRPNEIATHSSGHRFHERTVGPCQWNAIWIPVGDLLTAGRAIRGSTFEIPGGESRWRPTPDVLKPLINLHENAIRATATRPKLPVEREAARGLEEQVTLALIECFSGQPIKPDDAPATPPGGVLVRFEEVLQAAPAEGLSVARIADSLGVSETLLRTLCHARLGMAPSRYLYLRQTLLAGRRTANSNIG